MTALIARDRNSWRDIGKPRRYRTNAVCKEKRRYPDEVSIRAIGAVSIEERQNCARLWCYRCTHCHGWHLTHTNQGKRWEIKP